MKGGESKFAFEADLWSESIEHTVKLTNVYRQTDEEFVRMLNETRSGQLSADAIMKFKSLAREIEYHDGMSATELWGFFIYLR